jgi:hypothetical protein
MTYLASAGHWSATPPDGVALSDLLFTYIKGWGVQADSVGLFSPERSICSDQLISLAFVAVRR